MSKNYLSLTAKICILVLLSVGAGALFLFYKTNSSSDMDAPIAKLSYGEMGLLNTWPGELNEGSIAESLTAKNFYLIIDGSGSMWKTGCSNDQRKMRVAKDSISRFIDKIEQDANIGLLTFDYRGTDERVALGKDQQDVVKNALEEMSVSGSTPLATAVRKGREALTQQARRQLGYGEYSLVIVTDGEATDALSLQQEMAYLLENTPIMVHTIGFCIEDDHTLNKPGYTVYKPANDPVALDQALASLLVEAPSFQLNEFSN